MLTGACTLDRRLLIIGAGIEQIKAYQLAREMGLQTVGSDIDPNAPAFQFADDRILASTRDADETLRAVRAYVKSKPVDGVMTIANDVPFTVATVAHALGLPSISVESAEIAANKMLMKGRFVEHGVATPQYWVATSYRDLLDVVKEHGFPLVIKPIDGRGARGVFLLTADTFSEELFEESLGYSQTRTLLVERFIEGPQLSTESILYGGRLYTASYTLRNYEYLETLKPLVIENGGDQPADITIEQKTSIDVMILNAARAMGIDRGIIKGDIVLANGSPMVIELAARLSGGYFCTDQIPLATGVDLVKQVIKLAVDEPLDTNLVPRQRQAVAIRYWFPSPGIVREVTGLDQARSLPGVYRLEIFRNRNDIQYPITDHTKRAGFVITYGRSREEAISRAQLAIKTVKFHIDSN